MFLTLVFLISFFIILFTRQPNGRLQTGALVFAFFGGVWLAQWKDGDTSILYFFGLPCRTRLLPFLLLEMETEQSTNKPESFLTDRAANHHLVFISPLSECACKLYNRSWSYT